MAFKVQNSFAYGMLGDRLDAVRNSEVYKEGVREIDNMLITDIGSLKVAKQYEKFNLFSGQKLKSIKATSLGYYIVITSVNLLVVQERTNAILQTIAHGMTEAVDATVVGNDMIILFDGTTKFKTYSLKDTVVEDTSTFKKLKFPIKKKEILQLDLWKVTKNPYYTGNPDKDPPGTNALRVGQMSAFSDPLIKLAEDGTIMLHNSEIKIDRIYTSYNAAVAIEYFKDAKENDIYGVMRTYPVVEDGKEYILDNREVTIGALTEDASYKGKYFTTMTFKDGAGGTEEGVFTFGIVDAEIQYAQHIAFYQDRLFIHKNNYFYVSKIGDYANFRNETYSDSPFFFQLNPISGRNGNLINTISDIGLFVITTAGIYIIGYGGAQLSPSTFGSTIVVASDATATKEHCIKDNVLYFLNRQGILKAVFVDRLSQQIAFNTSTVDKYTNKKLYKSVSKMTIDDRDYVICRSVDDKHLYLIEPIDTTGIFRKMRIELDLGSYTDVIGSEEYLFADGDIFIPTLKNYAQAKIKMLKPDPAPYSSGGPINGILLYDNSSTINDIILKMLNEERSGIEGIRIDAKPVSNLSSTVPDNFDIYRIKTARRNISEITIEINTKSNDKFVELQCIEIGLDSIKDK